MFLQHLPLWLLGGILFISCKQDPIFYAISQEVEPIAPRVSGMPTNIVALGENLYVASRFSGTIHQYRTTGWDTLSNHPGGKILELAATDAYLYALTGNGDPNSAALHKMDETGDWQPITIGGLNIQTIYGASDRIVACVMTGGGKFAIYSLKDSEDVLDTKLKEETNFVQGLAYLEGTFYLATGGDGIYTFGDNSVQQAPGSAGHNVTGIITVGDTIVGVSRSGAILYGTTSFTAVSAGAAFTGALGLWEEGEKRLLLVGIQGSSNSTSHGYREIVLTEDGNLESTIRMNTPGDDPEYSSITNVDKYNSSLRRHPIVSFLQAKDNEKTLFAATVKNGLWSYRMRNGEYAWNAEG